SFRCRPGNPRLPSEPVLGVEVIAMNRVQLAWRDLTAAELQGETASLDFAVPPNLGLGAGDEARLEFRFFHLRNADLTITAVDLRGIENEETRPAPPRIWRMLGRLGGGPFLQLPAGYYRLEISADAGTPRMAAEPVLGVEITARRRWLDGRWRSWNSLLGRPPPRGVQLAWRDFTCAELRCGTASFDFEVPAELALEGGEDIVIGLHLRRLGNAGLAIKGVDVRQMTAAGAAPKSRQWRLLGRLSKGRIGVRQADGVAVRHSDPAGRFLHGSRPRLRLPRGRYRLSFCCQAGQPRIVSQPVLGVEVIARNRSVRIPALNLTRTGAAEGLRASREFTSEALAVEWASLDFDVPPELSCESSDEVGFEFRFVHLGNADLTVSAVNLDEIDGEDLPAKPPNFLVSPQRTRVLIVGNCQAQTIHEALVRSGEFQDRLDVKYHFVALQQNLHEAGKAELESSDVLDRKST